MACLRLGREPPACLRGLPLAAAGRQLGGSRRISWPAKPAGHWPGTHARTPSGSQRGGGAPPSRASVPAWAPPQLAPGPLPPCRRPPGSSPPRAPSFEPAPSWVRDSAWGKAPLASRCVCVGGGGGGGAPQRRRPAAPRAAAAGRPCLTLPSSPHCCQAAAKSPTGTAVYSRPPPSSPQDQSRILRRFKDGELNLLVSTAGAPEAASPGCCRGREDGIGDCMCIFILPGLMIVRHGCLRRTAACRIGGLDRRGWRGHTFPFLPFASPPPVAEEGVDVRSCQLVVRFDLPASAQSYIQARGEWTCGWLERRLEHCPPALCVGSRVAHLPPAAWFIPPPLLTPPLTCGPPLLLLPMCLGLRPAPAPAPASASTVARPRAHGQQRTAADDGGGRGGGACNGAAHGGGRGDPEPKPPRAPERGAGCLGWGLARPIRRRGSLPGPCCDPRPPARLLVFSPEQPLPCHQAYPSLEARAGRLGGPAGPSPWKAELPEHPFPLPNVD